MQENPTALDGILDIEPPAAPLLYLWENNAPGIILISLLGIFLFLAVAHFLWRRYFSTRGKARRQLEALRTHFKQQLKEQFKEQQLDNHQAAFQISNILCGGLNLKQLSSRTPLPDKLTPHNDYWNTFIKQLSIARYSAPGFQSKNILMLFDDARFWLKSWPVKKNG